MPVINFFKDLVAAAGRKSRERVIRQAVPAPQGAVRQMLKRYAAEKVSFTTRNGKRVNFVMTGARQADKREPNAYAKFVARRMAQLWPMSVREAQGAMRQIAREWRSRR